MNSCLLSALTFITCMKLSFFDSFVHEFRSNMGKDIQNLIEGRPKSFIQDDDLATFFADKTSDARYSAVKRFLLELK